MKILIVEDDLVSRSFLQKILETLGHKVLSAEDGRKALEFFQQNSVKMVITDWMMPEMDGLTLCRNIRQAKISHYVYLIFVTAKDQKKDTLRGLEAGADDYIVKPFDPEELRARIRTGQRIIQLEEDHKRTHMHMLQSEKMASIGQLAAGVAHEINNPTGFVSSNLKTLSDYQNDMFILIREYRKLITDLKQTGPSQANPTAIQKNLGRIAVLEKEMDLDFILDDIPGLIEESREGTERIKKIVMDLKDFAHPDKQELKYADINKNIDSTLNVVWNEIKYKATVTKEYGELPEMQCYPQQLNQVFMNLLVNAAQAIEKRGEIRIETRALDGYIEIAISDTGSGIPQENLFKIFDPFFTTKEVGKGTGLGLNVAYNIVKKHKGDLKVESEPGKGTTFIIRIPVGGEG
ncbi:MAG: response regulator [Pseudomonadota bacterium]